MGLFRFLFSKHKCLIYTAFGSQEYFRVVYKLKAAGVSFRTETFDNMRHFQSYFPREDNTQFDIYVRKEDEHKAQMAIHSK